MKHSGDSAFIVKENVKHHENHSMKHVTYNTKILNERKINNEIIFPTLQLMTVNKIYSIFSF